MDRHEEAKKHSAFEIARQVAGFLPGWTLRELPCYEGESESVRRQMADLRREDGAGIGFSIQTYPKLRLYLRGELPRADGQSWGRFDLTPVITVDPGKSPKAIAADIERRLLPGYLVQWTKGCEARDAHLARVAASGALGQRIADVLGARWREIDRNREEGTIYTDTIPDTYAKVVIHRSYGDEAKFEISLPGHLAVELAEWIAAHLQIAPQREGEPQIEAQP